MTAELSHQDILHQHYTDARLPLQTQSGIPACWSFGSIDEMGYFDHKKTHVYMARLIQKRMGFLPGQRVLDVGCGPGYYSNKFARAYPETNFIGLNLSGEQLQSAENYRSKSGLENLSFCQADFSVLPFQPDSFDSIMCIESLTHAKNIQMTLQGIRKVMRKDARLLIQDSYPISRSQDLDIDKLNALWLGPGFVPIVNLEEILRSLFSNVEIVDLTNQVLPSANHLAKISSQRLNENGLKNNMANGAILVHKLLQERKMGYFQIIVQP